MFVLALSLFGFTSCSSDVESTANPAPRMRLLLREASTVVVGVMAEDGSSGPVAVRPLKVLRGDPAVDGDGLMRFEWDAVVPSQGPVVWAFGGDGRPLEFRPVPLPWWPLDYGGVLGDVFADEVTAEASRILGVATVVVGLSRGSAQAVGGSETLDLVMVLHGGELIGEAKELSFDYADPAESPLPGAWGGVRFWALERVGERWVTVPSWLRAGWSCDDEVPIEVVRAVFSDVDVCP